MNLIPSTLHTADLRCAVRRVAATALLSLALGASLHAADWLQFRGPLASGTAEEGGLPAKLDAAKNLAWASDLPGRGLSSPIIVGNRVFVTASSGPKQDRLHVLCFDAREGRKLWERRFWATGRTMCHEKTAVAAPTPASDGQKIFALFSSNDLVCLDLEGNLIWLRGLTQDYPNASNSLGMSSSLVVVEGVVIAMIENDSESFTAGLDTESGTNRWKIDRPKRANWTSPVILKADGKPTLVGLQSSAGLSAVEPKTGKQVWNYGEGASTIPSSAVAAGVLFIPSQGLTALQLTGGDVPPRQLWRSSQLRPSTPSPVVVGDRVFTMNDAGVLSCGDTAAGRRLWQLRLKGPFSASPVAAGAFIYAVNEAGLLQVVDTSKPEGELVSEVDLKQTVLSTPSISGGAIYLRSDRTLWKYAQPIAL